MTVSEARRLLAILQQALTERRRGAINDASRALINGAAWLGGQWQAIATVLQHNGEHGLANRAAELWCAQADDDDAARFHRAAVLARSGRIDEAAAFSETLNPAVPTPAAHHFLRGTLATNQGRFDAARVQLRAATKADPRSGQAWLALAMVGMVAPEDEVAIRDAQGAMADAPPIERSAWFYALGKTEAEAGSIAAAFAAFDAGATLMRGERQYDGAGDAADAAAARDGWTAPAIAAVADQTRQQPKCRSLFVTGLPRSGTTLVEQVLASHSAVTGGGELGLFRFLEREIGGKRQADLDAYLRGGGSTAALRDLYAHLVGERYAGAGLVIDKTLNASRYIGLIAAVFPEAPIIWLRRDPLDCAWSAYRTWFLRGVDWSWSLADIAAHFRIEDALFACWTGLLGDRILVVDYARLVRDPEREIARITGHCGLALEPAQLTPHRTERTVTTASVAQVREPINTGALGSAQPFAAYLGAFTEAYSR